MTTNQELDLYNLLVPKLGEECAKALIAVIFNQKNSTQQEIIKLQENQKNNATKEEVARLQENQKELATKSDLERAIGLLKTDVANVRTEIANLCSEMKDSTNKIIMWAVGILILQSGFMFALKLFG